MPSKPDKIQRPWVPEIKKGSVLDRDKRYNTQRWRKIRRIGLWKEPMCVLCAKQNIVTLAEVRDHIKPVSEGGEFWSITNHQSLCISCHNRKSAIEKHSRTLTK